MGVRWDPDGCGGVWGVNKGGAVAQMYGFGGCWNVQGMCGGQRDL